MTLPSVWSVPSEDQVSLLHEKVEVSPLEWARPLTLDHRLAVLSVCAGNIHLRSRRVDVPGAQWDLLTPVPWDAPRGLLGVWDRRSLYTTIGEYLTARYDMTPEYAGSLLYLIHAVAGDEVFARAVRSLNAALGAAQVPPLIFATAEPVLRCYGSRGPEVQVRAAAAHEAWHGMAALSELPLSLRRTAMASLLGTLERKDS